MLAYSISILNGKEKIIKLLCVTWIITKLVCYKLWLGSRSFPLVPIHENLSALPSFIHTALFIVSICAMLFLLIFPNKKIALVVLFAEILSCLLDQNRWQPWEYQFIFMLAVYIYYRDEKQVRLGWQIILVGIYFFSGLSKLNSAFIHDIWQGLMLRRWLGISQPGIWLTRAGYALPIIEMLAAVCMCFFITRRMAIWILAFMHIIIILMFGPVGLNTNLGILPWNILMPLLVFILFYSESFQFKRDFKWKPFSFIILMCWWILPWLQLAGYWDKYLSAVLYGGGVEQLFICTDNSQAKKQLAPYFDKEFKVIPCQPVLSVYKWGLMEMNIAHYPEKRIFNAIIKDWKKRYPDGTNKFHMYKSGFNYKVREVVQKSN